MIVRDRPSSRDSPIGSTVIVGYLCLTYLNNLQITYDDWTSLVERGKMSFILSEKSFILGYL